MKRFLLVFCSLALILALTACDKSKRRSSAANDENENSSDAQSVASMTVPTQKELMPACNNWSKDDVEQYFAGKHQVIFEYAHNETVPKDCVISQNQLGGTELEPNASLIFVISLGKSPNPYGYSQKLVVTSTGKSTATMQLMNFEGGSWQLKYTCNATVGKNGIGYNYGEGKGITPAGTFKLGVILAETRPANAAWPYITVTKQTCVVDDTASTYYNTIQNIQSLPNGTHYDTLGETIISGNTDFCIYVEHNGDGITNQNVIPGKGSAITICGKTSSLYATAGCIDVAHTDLIHILSLMDYSNQPHIEITA